MGTIKLVLLSPPRQGPRT